MIDNVNLSAGHGERIGIAGESGSGKSTLLLAMMGVVKPGLSHLSGAIHFDGQPMLGRGDRELQSTRGGRLALIPQNAGTALTPSLRIGQQIDEALRLHTGLTGPERAERTVELLDRVKLPEPQLMMQRYRHQLSGGQVQRAAIAMALAGNPAALLLDEPATVLKPDAGAGQQGSKLRDRDDIESTGCSFAGRCIERLDVCRSVAPAWSGGHHRARCHLL